MKQKYSKHLSPILISLHLFAPPQLLHTVPSHMTHRCIHIHCTATDKNVDKKSTNQMMTGTGAAFEDNDWSSVRCHKSVLPFCLGWWPSGCHEQHCGNDVIAVWRWHYAAHLTRSLFVYKRNLVDSSFPCMKVALFTLPMRLGEFRIFQFCQWLKYCLISVGD